MERRLIVYFIVLFFCVKKIQAQEPQREVSLVELNFNDENGKPELRFNDKIITGKGKPIAVDLTKNDLRINLSKYNNMHLVKIFPEIKLDCEGIERQTDLGARQTSITINNGKLNGTNDIPVGSTIKFVLPAEKLSLTFSTGLPELVTCPEAVVVTTPLRNALPESVKIGIPFYDALFLSSSTDNEKRKEILKSYIKPKDNNLLTCAVMLENLKENAFLIDLAKKVCEDTVGSKQGTLLSSAVLSSIGGLDVTNIADGLAKFLVKRAKQELNMAFFEKFKERIDSTPDLQTLFPQTSNLLSALGDEVYEYQRYIQNLRESFKEDISELDKNLPGIIDNHPAYFSYHPELKATLLSGCYVAGELKNQAHPGDILAGYPIEYLDSADLNYKPLLKNYKGAIQTLQLISASLRDSSTAEDADYWVNIKQIGKLVNNKEAFKIYLGLIYQQALNQYDSIHFNGFSLVYALHEVGAQYGRIDSIYTAYRRYVLGFGAKVNALNAMIKNSDGSASDSSALEKFSKYFKASADLIEYSTAVSDLPVIHGTRFGNLHNLLKPYFDISNSVVDLAVAITKRNYSAAINQAVHIYYVVKVKPSRNEMEETTSKSNLTNSKEAGSSSGTADNSMKYNTISNPDSVKTDFANSNNTLNKLVKYGGFMATVATAKTSDDVENAIETFALPVGSSRVKRMSNWNFSLNGYLGLYYGSEKINGIDSNFKANSWGVFAPVGLAISKGHISLFGWEGHSVSLFGSLIDIGALASFRFGNDSVPSVPTVRLKDIISPGIFFSWGIGKTPLSLSFGYQTGPSLRKIDIQSSTNKLVNDRYNRISISLAVDIPILNFYTKSY